MVKARNQADRYVHALPQSESNPPFILVVDVGHIIEVYADFSRLGRTYTPFPDSQTHRIKLDDLANEEIRQRLAAIWTDPLSLKLIRIRDSLVTPPLFTMGDVGFLLIQLATHLLKKLEECPCGATATQGHLWLVISRVCSDPSSPTT